MAGNMTFVTKIKSILQSVRSTMINISRYPHQHGMLGMPAVSLDYGLVPGRSATHQNTPSKTLADIFGGILHYKVPRNRRSLEKRLSRKHGEHHFQHAKPKKNIVTCLSCGQPHEAETICGHCYSKVKKETELMKESMGEDKYYFDYPRKEVAFMYEGESVEEFPKYKGHYIVEIPKERPSWFSPVLSKKKNQKGSPDDAS